MCIITVLNILFCVLEESSHFLNNIAAIIYQISPFWNEKL